MCVRLCVCVCVCACVCVCEPDLTAYARHRQMRSPRAEFLVRTHACLHTQVLDLLVLGKGVIKKGYTPTTLIQLCV